MAIVVSYLRLTICSDRCRKECCAIQIDCHVCGEPLEYGSTACDEPWWCEECYCGVVQCSKKRPHASHEVRREDYNWFNCPGVPRLPKAIVMRR